MCMCSHAVIMPVLLSLQVCAILDISSGLAEWQLTRPIVQTCHSCPAPATQPVHGTLSPKDKEGKGLAP